METSEYSITELPNEILYAILRFCSIQSLGRLSQTNKNINENCNSNSLWMLQHPDPTSTKGILIASQSQVRLPSFITNSQNFHFAYSISSNFLVAANFDHGKEFAGINFYRTRRFWKTRPSLYFTPKS
jgi:hypothetical protein